MTRMRDDGGLVFCDVSTFYCERGGGIRTYHRARIEWFSQQSRHHYVLVVRFACHDQQQTEQLPALRLACSRRPAAEFTRVRALSRVGP